MGGGSSSSIINLVIFFSGQHINIACEHKNLEKPLLQVEPNFVCRHLSAWPSTNLLVVVVEHQSCLQILAFKDIFQVLVVACTPSTVGILDRV